MVMTMAYGLDERKAVPTSVLVLIAVEVVTTAVLVPVDETRGMWLVAVFLSATMWFRAMRARRERNLVRWQGRLSEASGGGVRVARARPGIW